MRSRIGTLVVLGLALSAPAFGQDYLPLSKGNTWTYDAEVFTGAAGFGVRVNTTVTAKVTALEAIGGVDHHVIRWTDGLGKLDTSIVVRARGERIWVARAKGRNMFLLPAHLSGGRAHLKVIVDGEAIELDALKVGKKSSITVPAGTYEAFPVTNAVTLPGVVIKTSVWYAAGTGPVQIEEVVTTGGTATVKRTLKLKAFSGTTGTTEPKRPVEARPKRVPTGKRPVAPDAPATPTKTKTGALETHVSGLLANGTSAKTMQSLKALALAALKRAGGLNNRVPAGLERLFDLRMQTLHDPDTLTSEATFKRHLLIAKTVHTEGSLDGSIVISNGLRVEGIAKNSILLVDGDVLVEGYLKDCIVLCTGKVKGEAYVKNNLIVSLKTVHADAYLKDNVIEAKLGASADARSKGNVYVNTRLIDTPSSKRDVHTTVKKLPSELLLGKRK